MSDILSSLAYLNGKPTAQGKLKAQADHFQVVENLGFEFDGHGEHLMVRIRKTGENTAFVANELAKACGVKSKDVSWSGLKDRHAVTEQWLSVHLPKGETPDFTEFLAKYPQIEILTTCRHNKKLRPGDHIGNGFVVTMSEVTDVADVVRRLENIMITGVPNYFGSQRFGHKGNNLSEARRWGRNNVRTRDQNKRSLFLSTARSWIFNSIVSARIEQGLFTQAILGDIALTDVKASDEDTGITNAKPILVNADNLANINESIANDSVQISAAMAGDNALPTQDAALALEQPCLDAEPDLMALIRGNRMRHDRRSIMLKAQDLQWSVDGDNITLKFALGSGCFATSIVRELIEEIEVERQYS
ncbi:tRNA pseudouridine(13) synthase TruD [Vibrio sinensis]|uniref:tRNA pseudouridine synthase D n=1 Tax=Vibrio sinensis TaxID=2302434 RepID=A0A3A6QLZ7_9VIBR|nr:tRNA pseudouridine(13) synthase TruD [Vibrio sinensis]RJX67387.1 tRNA pseudouridine(13) synthase TruD [Vibrio sinensis]